MAVLHDELNRLIGEVCTDASLKAEVVRYVLTRDGIALPESNIQLIAKAIDEGADTVEMPGDGGSLSLTITEDDVDQALRAFEDNLDKRVARVINLALEEIAPDVLQTLYATLPETLHEHRAAQHGFEERLLQQWQAILDRLEMLTIIAHEAGETYTQDIQREFADQEASQESDLIDVLVALHCRACRTAREILCLLRAGYADGANARWRSLHELAVTALFLLEHRGDIPQRYLDHAAVERWRAAEQYQTHCHTLGYEPFSNEEMAEMKQASDDMIAKYGKPFRHDYGWAAQALGIDRPSFAEIEANLDMSEWRPFFKLACQSIHAGSQGLFFSLALPDGAEAMLLAGASDSGIAEPAHYTAISLTMASSALLTSYPNLDGLITSKCMLMVCDDIGAMLFDSHEES